MPETASVSQVRPTHVSYGYGLPDTVLVKQCAPSQLPRYIQIMFERFVENTLYASRWLLAPVFLGLSLALLALSIKFFQELVHLLPGVLEMSESDLVLTVLALVDLSLVGSLLVMVMFSGYENFVSQMDIKEGTEKLGWLGKLDAGSLKLKVAASIVAISSIHLLRIFVNAHQIPDNKLMWYVILHMTFVVSALIVAYMDKMTKH